MLRLLNAVTATTSAPAVAFATGTITAVSGANLVDGETFTIQLTNRGLSVTFEFDSNSSVTAGRVAVTFAGGDTNAQVATAIANAITGATALAMTAGAVGATVTVTANNPGSTWNAGVTETVANGTFAVTDITGGSLGGINLQSSQLATPGGGFYWQKRWNNGAICISGAGTGALTFQGIIWLFSPSVNTWMPAGISATIADRGKLNDGTTITGTTTLVHTQPIYGLSGYDRIALQATTLTGTGMTVSAFLVPIVPEG